MKRLLTIMTMGAGLSLIAPAFAQDQPQPQPEPMPDQTQPPQQDEPVLPPPDQQQQPQQQQQQQQQQPQQQQSGSLSGEVSKLELDKGKVTIKSEQGDDVTLHAKPHQLAQLRKGEQLQASFQKFGDQMWLMENLDAKVTDNDKFGKEESISGDVSQVDQNKGRLTISTEDGKTKTIHAHPAQIESLSSGQKVTLQVQKVGKDMWLQSVGSEGQTGA